MALMKTSQLSKAIPGPSLRSDDQIAKPARPTETRRSQDRSRVRQQKAAERIGAATEELASGVAEAASAAEELRRL